MRKSTIKLTKKEFDFINSKEYPISKRAVIQKICLQFDELGPALLENLIPINPKAAAELQNSSFKTTRGENYQSLPYVVLDYPKIKQKDFTILCRTMFWWGKYVSLNVFLKADEFDIKKIANALMQTSIKKIKLYDGKDIWQQNLNDKHFIKLSNLNEEELYSILKKQLYLKLSLKVRFDKLDKLNDRAVNFYSTILSIL